MKHKLRRSRRSVFRRKRMSPGLKTVLWIVICVAVVAAGYFGAMLVSEGGLPKPHTQAPTPDAPAVSPTAPDEPNTPADQPTEDPKPTDKPADTPAANDTLRAFYLPHAALKAEDLSATLTAASQAGFTAVTFDLKDADGALHYRFTCSQAKKVAGFTEDALSEEELKSLFSLIRKAGLQPIPRLYAFRDHLGAKALADARVMVESNHSWSWHDADPNNGGRRWLNPYAEAAHAYIGALAEELKTLGAAAVMLDGVQFPHQLSSAYFGEDAATVSKSDALTAFVEKMRTQLGEDCSLILSCTAESALGTDTKVYGGNPLTFGATVTSPILSSKIQESVEKMVFRTQGPDAAKTALAPTLSVADLSAEKVSEAIAACIKGGADSFLLYDPAGTYDFAAYSF